MAKEKEVKVTLEREYIIPLRWQWLKVPEYKRANKAAKAIRQFMVRHMKIYDRDLKKVKIDILLNNELRFRGMRKPPAKIKVKAKKFDDGIVRVELVNIPVHIKFEQLREKKKAMKVKKKEEKKPAVAEKKEEKPTEEKKETAEEKKEKEEKKESVKEAGFKEAKQQAKQMKHTSVDKQVTIKRKALAR